MALRLGHYHFFERPLVTNKWTSRCFTHVPGSQGRRYNSAARKLGKMVVYQPLLRSFQSHIPKRNSGHFQVCRRYWNKNIALRKNDGDWHNCAALFKRHELGMRPLILFEQQVLRCKEECRMMPASGLRIAAMRLCRAENELLVQRQMLNLKKNRRFMLQLSYTLSKAPFSKLRPWWYPTRGSARGLQYLVQEFIALR
jgi:hypothetical protein